MANVVFKTSGNLLSARNKPSGESKRIFFGQLLVETTHSEVNFAKEVANAVIIQADMNGTAVDFTPVGDKFVTRIEENGHVLLFEGVLAGYLKVPPEDAVTLHVSFRRATEEDNDTVRGNVDLVPTYALMFSIISSHPGEFGDDGFWNQLGINLFTGLSTEGEGRSGDPNVKIAIAYGDENYYRIIKPKDDQTQK